jgi:hypothetical protein
MAFRQRPQRHAGEARKPQANTRHSGITICMMLLPTPLISIALRSRATARMSARVFAIATLLAGLGWSSAIANRSGPRYLGDAEFFHGVEHQFALQSTVET